MLLYLFTYLNYLRENNKKVKNIDMGVRGFIVPKGKGSKQRLIIQKRLYSSSSKSKKLSQVSEKPISKDFLTLAKH